MEPRSSWEGALHAIYGQILIRVDVLAMPEAFFRPVGSSSHERTQLARSLKDEIAQTLTHIDRRTLTEQFDQLAKHDSNRPKYLGR